MDGNLAMNSQFENMSEKDMEQQEERIWVDQAWPKKKTTASLIIELAKMMDTTPVMLHNWLINNGERLKNDSANEIKEAYADGRNMGGKHNDPRIAEEYFDKNYEQ